MIFIFLNKILCCLTIMLIRKWSSINGSVWGIKWCCAPWHSRGTEIGERWQVVATHGYLTHIRGMRYKIDRDKGSKATALSSDRVRSALRDGGGGSRNWDALSVAFSMTWMTSLRRADEKTGPKTLRRGKRKRRITDGPTRRVHAGIWKLRLSREKAIRVSCNRFMLLSASRILSDQ